MTFSNARSAVVAARNLPERATATYSATSVPSTRATWRSAPGTKLLLPQR
ncbi:hypothetical protein JG687_00019285 [Phytophthora cactorum]|uniref:Uncharacterized protein n=1 Tax=Phytophthora cactorum TaxID=29920 RepID=A0A8T1TKW4_9STRA|nr:hypothetical protein JG687_00019285 [Phytophthora cactorum]